MFAPRFAKAAADLLGVDGVRLYHDQALLKEPGGGHTPWHQDQFYWPFDTEKTITMWMPLADLDPAVGSMTFATGSHRAGKLRGHAISDASEAEFGTTRPRPATRASRLWRAAGRGRDVPRGLDAPPRGVRTRPTARPVMTVIYFADGALVSRSPTPCTKSSTSRLGCPGMQPGDLAASEINPRLGPVGDSL